MTPEEIQLLVHGSEEYFFYGLQIGLVMIVSFYLILLIRRRGM
jgi:tetrahydromethanopterin S-methyltransferase subunit B